MSADSYVQYTEGVKDSTNSAYNFLVSGKGDYNNSGLMIKGDTTTAKGTHIYQDANDNAYFDLRSTAGGAKNIAMRLQNHSDGSLANLLVLTDDDKSSTSTYGAQVGGRVKASQFYVGEADTRAHSSQGVYVGQDASSVAYFNINKGTGTGGFKFGTYGADGTLAQSNLELAADGSVKIDKYKATTNAQDSEANAIASFDANGNLVRNYQQNQRLRSIEERVTDLETETTQTVPAKVNQIIGRINGLKFFSNDIEALVINAPPTPFNP